MISQIERKLLLRYPNMRRLSTMLARDRNSCASLGNDRFRASHKFKESKIRKIAKTYSVKEDDKNDQNNNIICMTGDDKKKSETNRKKVVLNLDSDTNKKQRSSIFNRRKKESNSTITSSLASSKGSKGTIRFDSIDTNNLNNMGEDSETLTRPNSSHKEGNYELTEPKANKKFSYVDLNEKNPDEHINLIEH